MSINKVEILDKKIIFDNKSFEQTALVTFYNEKGLIIKKEEYGIIKKEQIYKNIKNKLAINIDRCYIKNFSLEDYRKIEKLTPQTRVELKDFTAYESFFENTHKLDLSYVDFIGEKTDFSKSYLGEKEISFLDTSFSAKVTSFKQTNFGNENINFSLSVFQDSKIDFSSSKFGNGEIKFYGICSSTGNINFSKCHFGNGNLIFDDSEFGEGEINFYKSNFGNGNISFYKVSADKIRLTGCHLNNYTDFRVEKCNFLDLSDTIIRDIVDLKPDNISNVNIESLKISNVKNLGTIIIDWKSNNLKNSIYNQFNKKNLEDITEQFRILKENFAKLGQYDDEDKAYVEYKKCEIRSEFFCKKNKNRTIHYIKNLPKFIFKWTIFEKMGEFGTNPVSVLFSMIVVYFLFTLLYVLTPFICEKSMLVQAVSDSPDNLNLFLKSAYHSAITFLSIGYGDYYPTGVIRLLSGIEGFFGLFLMSYFTVAFMRKVLR